MLTVPPVSADEAGQTAAEVLRLGAGAEIPAMGGAGVASVNRPAAMQYNPAGLARISSGDIEVTYQPMVEDINVGNIDLARNLGQGTFGLGIRYVDYGGQDRVEFEPGNVGDPDALTTVGTFSNSDVVFSGGYGLAPRRNLTIGATGKVIRQELAGVVGTAYAADLGLQWTSTEVPLGWGISVANLGSDITFDEADEPLPALVRSGLSYRIVSMNVRMSVDGEYTFESGTTGFRGGLEWKPWTIMALRAGYDGNLDVDNGITGGLGFRFNDMTVDYAFLPYGEFGNTHRFTMGWQF